MDSTLVNHRFLHDLGITPSVLIVEDSPADARLIHKALGEECRVFVAGTRDKALQLASRRMFDIMVVDYELDRGTALDLLRDIRLDGLNRHTPALVVTAHADGELESSCLNAGAADFITKPFSPQVLRARIKTQLLLRVRNDMLRELIMRDEDTGLYQRTYLHEQLVLAVELARRNGTPLSIINCDLDHFGSCADGLDTTETVRLLQRITALLEPSAHGHRNTLARQGNDRFVWMLPGLALEGALGLAERMRQRLVDGAIPCPVSADRCVTASFGVCTADGRYPDRHDALMDCADKALEAAQQAGRNTVVGGLWASDSAPTP